MADIVKVESKLREWVENGTPIKVEDLYGDVEQQAYVSHLATILNTPPKKEWLKVNNGIQYLPIEKQEFLMSYFFGEYRVEVKDVKVIANAVAVTVRVHYFYNFKGSKPEWRYTDGVGAVPIQVNKGSSPNDFSQIKYNAIQIGLPAAKSYAFKDAVESLGAIFGKDLNRKNGIGYGALLEINGGVRFEFESTDVPDIGIEESLGIAPEEIEKLKQH
jgi:hypothetical protein